MSTRKGFFTSLLQNQEAKPQMKNVACNLEGAAYVPGDYEYRDYTGPIKFFGTDCQVDKASFVLHVGDGSCRYNYIRPNSYITFTGGDVVSGSMRCLKWLDGTFKGDDLQVHDAFMTGEFLGKTMHARSVEGGTVSAGEVACRTWCGATFNGSRLTVHNGYLPQDDYSDQDSAFMYGIFNSGEFRGNWKSGVFNAGIFRGNWLGGTWGNGTWAGKCLIGDGSFEYVKSHS